MASMEQAAPVGHEHLVTVTVNNNHDVKVEGPHTTGLQIKQAAVEQGAGIQLDFVLSEELPGGRTKIIGDHDKVVIHPGSRFVAIPNDDNS
jgi:hypothetical protein